MFQVFTQQTTYINVITSQHHINYIILHHNTQFFPISSEIKWHHFFYILPGGVQAEQGRPTDPALVSHLALVRPGLGKGLLQGAMERCFFFFFWGG